MKQAPSEPGPAPERGACRRNGFAITMTPGVQWQWGENVDNADWDRQFFGGKRPPSRWALLGVVCASIALFLCAWSIDFLAARWLMWIMWIPAIYVGVTRAHWLMWFLSCGQYFLNDRRGVVRKFCAVMVAILAWFVLVRVGGGGITRLTGRVTTSSPMELSLWHSASVGGCHDLLTGGAMSQFGQGRLCVSKTFAAVHPEEGSRSRWFGTLYPAPHIKVQLVGRQGPLGFCITGFRDMRDPSVLWH